MPREILFIGGSPSSTSRSWFVARAVAKELGRASNAAGEEWAAREFSLHDFDAEDVFLARTQAPKVGHFLEAVKGAAALVLSTPVYKATYAGGLKAIVDLIPQDGLLNRPVLGIATTRLAAHGREVERAYEALFAFFRARAARPLVVLDEEIHLDGGVGTFTDTARERVQNAANELRAALKTSG
ncbi:MAG TPA: NAD(P)H-dependent oxidoreductase [Polyangiaceae bacterium]|nr:NAD(P)H-dependent oxidoreductase [Polyangiaceae bacterium]